MTYYKVTHSIDPTIIGQYDQIQDIAKEYASTGKIFYYQNSETGKFDQDINWPVYRMEEKSKLTDLISNVPLTTTNLMISKKVLDVLKHFKIPEYQVYPIKFTWKGKLFTDYIAFSIVKDPKFLEFISWERSKFYKTENFHQKIVEEFKLSNILEFNKLKQDLNDEIYGFLPDIKMTCKDAYDLINFGRYPMPIGFICNEKVKNAINENNFTGFDFKQVPNEMFVES